MENVPEPPQGAWEGPSVLKCSMPCGRISVVQSLLGSPSVRSAGRSRPCSTGAAVEATEIKACWSWGLTCAGWGQMGGGYRG